MIILQNSDSHTWSLGVFCRRHLWLEIPRVIWVQCSQKYWVMSPRIRKYILLSCIHTSIHDSRLDHLSGITLVAKSILPQFLIRHWSNQTSSLQERLKLTVCEAGLFPLDDKACSSDQFFPNNRHLAQATGELWPGILSNGSNRKASHMIRWLDEGMDTLSLLLASSILSDKFTFEAAISDSTGSDIS